MAPVAIAVAIGTTAPERSCDCSIISWPPGLGWPQRSCTASAACCRSTLARSRCLIHRQLQLWRGAGSSAAVHMLLCVTPWTTAADNGRAQERVHSIDAVLARRKQCQQVFRPSRLPVLYPSLSPGQHRLWSVHQSSTRQPSSVAAATRVVTGNCSITCHSKSFSSRSQC